MAVLQFDDGTTHGRIYRIKNGRVVLGRHPDCDVFDVFLDANAVSRRHARIVEDKQEFFVEDMRSRNGTIVNGQPITGRVPLQDGDRLRICEVEFRFFQHEPSATIDSGLTDIPPLPALMVDDEPQGSGSTIMSQVEVASSARSGLQLVANAETKLNALVEMLGNLGQSLDLDDVLDHLLTGLFKIFIQADRGFIGLKLPGDGPVIPRAIKHRRPTIDDSLRVSRTIVNRVMETKQAILSADAASDERFDMAQSIADFQIRSLMCAPLLDSERNSLGVIQIDTVDQANRFQHEDLEVLASVAPQAAFALEYAQLYEQGLRQRALERDLEIARSVQHGLLPSEQPDLPGYHFFDFYEPAHQVGGDYYDYIQLPGGRLAVVLADVSGKGVSAALLMANLSGELKFSLASAESPAAAVDAINADLSKARWDDYFVTMILAVIDPATGETDLVNAGHMPPFLRHADGRVEEVGEEQGGLPLGVTADVNYASYHMTLAPGDSLTMFTDGFSEAMNAQKDLYGLERLRNQLSGEIDEITQLGRRILSDVKVFVRGHPQSDDMCLVCFGRDGEDRVGLEDTDP
jgi:sigma-B regulation protein RsbU (phosphoserine phosphatase)